MMPTCAWPDSKSSRCLFFFIPEHEFFGTGTLNLTPISTKQSQPQAGTKATPSPQPSCLLTALNSSPFGHLSCLFLPPLIQLSSQLFETPA